MLTVLNLTAWKILRDGGGEEKERGRVGVGRGCEIVCVCVCVCVRECVRA